MYNFKSCLGINVISMSYIIIFVYFFLQNEIEPAREAYDAFLAHYPYCYGYWRKYADYEKRKGNKKKCEEVCEIFLYFY